MKRLVPVLVLAAVVVLVWLWRTDRARSESDRAARTDRTAVEDKGSGESSDPSHESSEEGDGESSSRAGKHDAESGEQKDPLTTETEFRLRVEVRDSEKAPLEAKVVVFQQMRVAGGWRLGVLSTGKDGACSSFLPEADRYYVEVTFDGTTHLRRFEVSAAKPSAVVKLALAGGATITGQVHGAQGLIERNVQGEQPTLGQERLKVELLPRDGDDESDDAAPFALLGEDGRYRLTGLAAGKYHLRIKKKYYAKRLDLEANEHLVHDIKLPGGRIRGRVVDDATGEPTERVQVIMALVASDTGRDQALRAARTPRFSDRLTPDADGYYSFTNLPTGEYGLLSNGVEYGQSRKYVTLTADVTEATVDFRLTKGSSVDITVTDLEGEPVQQPLLSTPHIRWGFTGQVGGIAAGTYDFFAGGIGYEMQMRKDVVFKPGEATKLEFKLAKEAATKLFFKDEAGQPVAGVRVNIPLGSSNLQALMGRWFAARGEPYILTGAAGYVMVRGVKAGPRRVVAKKTGYELFDAPVKFAQGKEEATVVLKAGDTTFNFRLKVRDVTPGRQAARLGVRPGATIVSYNGVKPVLPSDLAKAIADAAQAGLATVELIIEMDGERRKFQITTGALGISTASIEE